MLNLIYVAAGGAMGASLRYLFGIGATRLLGVHFPYGTLGVNLIGSLMMGLFVGFMAKHGSGGQTLHLLVAVGLLGGFTTFSSFSLDVITLFQRGELWQAAVYLAASVLLCIAALFAGLYMMRGIA